MMRVRIGLPFLLLLLFSSQLLGQKFGKVTGTIMDAQSGDPLPGANVIVDGTSLGAASDLEGRYTILRIPPGRYELRINFIGYKTVVIQNVEVLTDLTTEINFNLEEETLAGEEVVVIAERPIIRKDLTSVESRVQAEEIGRMPVQELGDVLNLQAGINRDKSGGIHIRGGRSTEVAYMVNGIRITDDFTKSQSIQIENASVQELQVISGTFNAEYGEALSGVVNIVTKSGSNVFHGGVEVWSGDYVSGNKKIFFNVDDVDPAANNNLQASLSGPIIKDRLTFFVTGRRYNNDGYLYGANAYNISPFVFSNGDTTLAFGDSSAVPLNFSDRWSGQASLEWKIAGPLKFKIDALGSKQTHGKYSHKSRLVPLGIRNDEEQGFAIIANLTHAISEKTFYELTASYKENQLNSALYDDPVDPRYIHPDYTRALFVQFFGLTATEGDEFEAAPNEFNIFGSEMARFSRKTKSWIGKLDVTSQASERHQLKTGIELKTDDVFMDDYSLQFDPGAPNGISLQGSIRSPDLAGRNILSRKPLTFAAYVQDKIEYESLIINAGLRLDVFNPKGEVPIDLTDPNIFSPTKPRNIWRDQNGDGIISLSEQTNENLKTVEERRADGWYQDTSVKMQLSPRLGIAYPITDEGVIHFSFGIFSQIPDYEQLYREDVLKITTASGVQGERFGNPDLKPQKTTMYELGLQQQLSENIGADLTFFYRDIRDWVGVSAAIDAFTAGVTYARRVNRDFANVTGFTLALNRRFANHFSLGVDYTFQVAEGTNSNPNEEFFTQRDGKEPTKQLTPLEWDQRHALNSTLFVGSNHWGVSLIERLNSGQPFTPVPSTARQTGTTIIQGLEKNSRRKPATFTLDLNAFRNFDFGKYHVRPFVKVFNVLDSKNPTDVFGDTGLADFSLNELYGGSISPGYFVRPDFYSEPREVQIGMSIGF